jgi:hypothetical protein
VAIDVFLQLFYFIYYRTNNDEITRGSWVDLRRQRYVRIVIKMEEKKFKVNSLMQHHRLVSIKDGT